MLNELKPHILHQAWAKILMWTMLTICTLSLLQCTFPNSYPTMVKDFEPIAQIHIQTNQTIIARYFLGFLVVLVATKLQELIYWHIGKILFYCAIFAFVVTHCLIDCYKFSQIVQCFMFFLHFFHQSSNFPNFVIIWWDQSFTQKLGFVICKHLLSSKNLL